MKKRQPLVRPVTIETITKKDIDNLSTDELYDIFQTLLKEIYPIPQLTYDVRKNYDYIHIRNMAIRCVLSFMEKYECEHCGSKCSYNKRIQNMVRDWFTSPKSIERIANNNPTDK